MYKKYCEICGRKFETKQPQARMCSDECRKIRAVQWRAEHKEAGKLRKNKLNEVNRLAREAGMTYGKYVAMQYKEKLKNERTM